MFRILKSEILKSKRLPILWVGVLTSLVAALLSAQVATANDGTIYDFDLFMSNCIWLNGSLLFPATITLLVGYSIDKERKDGTLKNLLSIPLSYYEIFAGKIIAGFLLSIFLAFCENIFAVLLFFGSDRPGFTWQLELSMLAKMIGMNICTYIAVLPVLAVLAKTPKNLMVGVVFSVFYGFIGVFTTGRNLTSIYPISAGLVIIDHSGINKGNGDMTKSIIVMGIMLALTCIIMIVRTDVERIISDENTKKIRHLRKKTESDDLP